ncbi:hypothetical protein V6L77_01145 [Pannonibacter sp. Pt2-lr]
MTALNSANVTITTGGAGSAGTQAGTITVADAVTWTSGSRLALSAYGDIIVNANLTGGTGSSIVLRADNSGTGTGTVTLGRVSRQRLRAGCRSIIIRRATATARSTAPVTRRR